MVKLKKKYDVYLRITHDTVWWDGEITTEEYFAGSTMAVSEKQAINNVRFRRDGKDYNHWAEQGFGDTATFYDYIAYER